MNFKINNINNLSVTEILIITNVLIFVIMYLFNLNAYFISEFSSMGYIWELSQDGRYVQKTEKTIFDLNEFYRLLTANYLHGGLMHIMFNMIALYSLGQVIESLIGKMKFFIAYTLSGIGGTVLSSSMSIYFSPNNFVPSVGASGAVFGIAGCLVVLAIYRRSKGIDLLYRINYQPLVVMLGLNLIMGQMVDRIDNWGHIGGLITGCVIGGIYSYMIEKRNLNNF